MTDSHPLSQTKPWDAVVQGYVEATLPILREFSKEALKDLRLTSDMNVLDLACGPGTTTLLMAPRVRRVVALDFSANMLASLKKSLDGVTTKNVDVIEADGQATPCASASFDAVISMFGLMFFRLFSFRSGSPDHLLQAQAFSTLNR